jgi:hypothetical protein
MISEMVVDRGDKGQAILGSIEEEDQRWLVNMEEEGQMILNIRGEGLVILKNMSHPCHLLRQPLILDCRIREVIY